MDDTDRSHGLVATPAPAIPGPRSSGRAMNAVARPGLAGGREVGLVRRGQHDLPRLKPEQRGRPQVRLAGPACRPATRPSRGSGPRAARPPSPCQAAGKCSRSTVAPRCSRASSPRSRPRCRATAAGSARRALSPSRSAGSKRPGSSPRSAQYAVEILPVQHVQRDKGPRRPAQTRRIAGPYRTARHRRTRAASSLRPCSPANRRTAAATPDRQSTTVPNTSNRTAFTAWPVDTAVNVTVPASHPGRRASSTHA